MITLFYRTILLFILVYFIACTHVPHSTRKSNIEKFVMIAQSKNERIWSPHLSSKTIQAISDYNQKKELNSGKIYGDSVRNYDLKNKCPEDIDKDMLQMKCQRKDDVLKNPKTNQPLIAPNQNTIPMISYLCPDGGIIRLKPQGDPTSQYKPQPLVSKGLRYPFNSKFENFDDEIIKIDNFGNAIPKWTKDLNPKLGEPTEQTQFSQGWADDAHTDLKLNCDSTSI